MTDARLVEYYAEVELVELSAGRYALCDHTGMVLTPIIAPDDVAAKEAAANWSRRAWEDGRRENS